MLAYSRSVRFSKGNAHDNNNDIATHVQQLCSSLNNQQTNNTLSPICLLRNAINKVDNSQLFREELTKLFVPVLVTTNLNDPMIERYAAILCRKLVTHNNCHILASIPGFITYIQKAIKSEHICVSSPACDVMMRIVIYEPNNILCNDGLCYHQLVRVAVDNLSSNADVNKCLDAIRFLTILNNNSYLSPDNELCEHLVETFCNVTTPFVSKQTAILILLLTADDDNVKYAVTSLLNKNISEDKPIKSSRCWKEVNDIVSFVSH